MTPTEEILILSVIFAVNVIAIGLGLYFDFGVMYPKGHLYYQGQHSEPTSSTAKIYQCSNKSGCRQGLFTLYNDFSYTSVDTKMLSTTITT